MITFTTAVHNTDIIGKDKLIFNLLSMVLVWGVEKYLLPMKYLYLAYSIKKQTNKNSSR